ncbi:cell division protein FtsI [Actinocorallia sp. API 0066]|uniref:penicillin-binding transpeptidase domain-containing protein n=1 Tax=Actinocorallia sp. API 0066 TaxID=2896846 RepID=UPI001E4E47D5|nr:penicillin-binding transpeptidase domain-containing protein [Actinocorallia sp. API 0066]MCD0448834.1 cell division protein FtsI [Actinocorallia sp. API 0066]
MRWLAIILGTALLAGAGGGLYLHLRVKGDPRDVAAEYFAYWRAGDFDAMRTLVAHPPSDFVTQHREFSKALQVRSLNLSTRPVVRVGEQEAKADFTAVRELPPGEWAVESSLRLRVVERHWRVVWGPATLAPELARGGALQLRETEAPTGNAVYADGSPISPTSSVTQYVDRLRGQYQTGSGATGWGVFLDGTPIKVFSEPKAPKLQTTLDAKAQAAADKVVKEAPKPTALVALRPSTGAVLALADGVSSQAVTQGAYPPGSTFKIVTAAALASSGLSPSSSVSCPASKLIGQRTITNHDGLDLGTTTLRTAFARSCNTTFADLGVNRAQAAGMTDAAELFAFNRPFAFNAARPSFPAPSGTADLAEAAIGQGRVLVSPLTMAAVAAAVANGTWRSPVMFPVGAYAQAGEDVPDPRPLPAAVVSVLRPLMAAVVTSGTAASAGLPPGTHGKTGTAEYDATGAAHAWFVGYRGDLAFAVLVPSGGDGGRTAAPLAATFLKAL